MKKTTGKIIQLIVIGVLACVFIAANVVLRFFAGIIDQYLGDNFKPAETLDPKEGDLAVQKVAEEGFVLLKNQDDALPLVDVTNVNLFGWCSSDAGTLMCGGGSGDFTMWSKDDPVKEITGLKEALESLSDEPFSVNPDLVEYYESYCTVNRNGGTDSRSGWFNYNGDPKYFNLVEPNINDYPQDVLNSALEYSDTSIVVITRTGGESLDLPKYQRKFIPSGDGSSASNGRVVTDNTRTYLQLSTEEEALINYVKENYENVIIVLNTSATLECGFIQDSNIDAALYIATPGQSGLKALAKILRGESTPSGKLVDTFAYDLTTAASYANSPDANVVNGATGEKTFSNSSSEEYIDYLEGIYVGYKWYETADAENFWADVDNEYGTGYEGVVQYPFGFGLSYTQFEWTVKSVSPSNASRINADTPIEIKVDVRNIGTMPGKDVVEVYYEPPYTPGGVEKSSSNLVAFAKTELLQPNDIQTLTLTFTAEDMKSYDCYNLSGSVGENGGYVLEEGEYIIKLSTDCHTLKEGLKNSEIIYTVDENIAIEVDSATGNPVENRFTGDTADGGISIDGMNVQGWDMKYLTRADFAASFPQQTSERRAKASNFNPNGWLSTKKDTTEMPTQGVAGDKKLIENMGTASAYYNDELITQLGDENNYYDDELWDPVLNQISTNELFDLAMKGGYTANKLPSIGKPTTVDLDGPTGFNRHPHSTPEFSGFPSAIVVAGTWNTNVAELFGRVVGMEGVAAGYGGWYAPGMNIHRSPFDGRNYEYFSEDPYISGIIGASIVEGATKEGIYCYIKHFAINETENQRNGLYTWLSEQTLREVYLRPFELSVKVGKANAIMSSYNRIGDTWTGGSYGLMTDILRNEWGFKGTAVTDYLDGSDSYKTVDQGIRAGNDIWLENGNDANYSAVGLRDTKSATAVACVRDVAKHVIFTYCNTRKTAIDDGNASDEVIQYEKGFSTWKIFWIIGDVVAFGGLIAWGALVTIKLIKVKKIG
ncbi:MAG: glycoside hydrolase family 3 protein [Clostridia bacterium]|nr:glycoside hydrolase family 3 protein [Clostridia bacterium]